MLVDDDSDDGTAATAARRPPQPLGASERLEVLRGTAAAAGLDRQALGAASGRRSTRRRASAPDYLLLTDADIGHAPDNLRALVPRAEREGYGAGLADGATVLHGAGRSVS